MNNIIQSGKALAGAVGFNSFSRDQKPLTFYNEGKNYWPHLIGLLNTILQETLLPICYISSSIDDPGLRFKHPRLKTFFIGTGFTRDYVFQSLDTNIMVMTMPDLHQYQVKRSKYPVHYIYVPHSLVSLHMIYRHGAFDHFDTIGCAGPHHIKEIRALENKYNLPTKNIIEMGYSRLDSLIEQAKKYPPIQNKTSQKKILIAPSWGPEGLIESGVGLRLISELLDLGHEVILRPHPQTIKFGIKQIDKILKYHLSHQSFLYEDNVAGQESLHCSNIMVSDWSGAALEYAFALKKPVIFCDIPKKINNPYYQEIELEPLEVSIRPQIGVIWDGQCPIKESLFKCENKEVRDFEWLSRQYVFNIGSSDQYFCQYIQSQLADV